MTFPINSNPSLICRYVQFLFLKISILSMTCCGRSSRVFVSYFFNSCFTLLIKCWPLCFKYLHSSDAFINIIVNYTDISLTQVIFTSHCLIIIISSCPNKKLRLTNKKLDASVFATNKTTRQGSAQLKDFWNWGLSSYDRKDSSEVWI